MATIPTHRLNASLAAVGAAGRYTAGTVAWNDGQRGVSNGALSCLGGNITDCKIVTMDGGVCPYIKPPNMDETIGVLEAKHLLMADTDGATVSLQDVLDALPERCAYRGFASVDAKVKTPEKVVVRFQTAWVPIRKGAGCTRIAPQHYSYQTRSRDNPRNLLLLGTPQGTFVHTDDAGGNTLHAHRRTEAGEATKHWFSAEPNKDCLVGHAADAAKDEGLGADKARAVEMGVRGMGARTNCFVTVSVPNKQAQLRSMSWADVEEEEEEFEAVPCFRSVAAKGVSHSARVSVDDAPVGTCAKNPIAIERPDGEPIVVTVLTYNTLEVPEDFPGDATSLEVETKDVALGVADLDRQHELVKHNGGVVCKLSELPAMLRKLTAADVAAIVAKVNEDPPPAADPMVPTKSALAAVA